MIQVGKNVILCCMQLIRSTKFKNEEKDFREKAMQEKDLKQLLGEISLKEKVNQLLQLRGDFYTSDDEGVITGGVQELGLTQEDIDLAGSVLSLSGAEKTIEVQKRYMEKQPHHIPLMFMLDVIHGFRTVYPAPIGQGATFDPELVQECAEMAAKEAAVSGIHLTFSPMVDLVRDARWGRVVESTGEDPYLNAAMAVAMVKGYQGDDLADKDHVAACVKHFAAYGGAEAGRDYNTVQLSEHTLREYYLPGYKAAIDAGAATVMTSFNTINDEPATTSKWLMRDVLRGEMGFDGVLISDYAAIAETIAHGSSADAAEAAKKAIIAGVDIDMVTNIYASNLVDMIEKGEVDEKLVDEAVLRILELKNRLGLFENPYKGADPLQEKEVILCEAHRELARKAVTESAVLLKNDGILPLSTENRTAFIGPYTDNKEMLSAWAIIGDSKDTVTIKEAALKVFDPEKTSYNAGSHMVGDDVLLLGFTDVSDPYQGVEQETLVKDAVAAAKEADVVVMPIGEHFTQTGEASSRAMIEVPEIQMELFREIYAVNKNIVVVLFNGRPLDIRELSQKARAILEVWMPGTEGGSGIIDLLIGKDNPSGKLPMSFPYCVGQVPVYYNAFSTGRPMVPGRIEKFKSRYLDIPNEPLYPFGYGLSYTKFEYSPVKLSENEMTADGRITASVVLTNAGPLKGTETVQLYIRDDKASMARPVKELKGFRRVELEAGESETVTFDIANKELSFIRRDGSFGSEAGSFTVWIGGSSSTENEASFTLKALQQDTE